MKIYYLRMNMKSTNIISLKCLSFLMIVTSFFSFTCVSQSSSDLPNIIFIITDDQQIGLTSIEGNPVSKTPNIDRLANKGIAFTRGYSSAPLCNPSRVSLLTGILPSNSGVYGNQENFREYPNHY